MNGLNFEDNDFNKNKSVLKYDINKNNTKHQVYIYINEDTDEGIDITKLQSLSYIVENNKQSIDEIINKIKHMVQIKVLCENLEYPDIEESLNSCNMLVVIGENLPNGNIYSFSSLTFIDKLTTTIYGQASDNYLYADYICSHKNIKNAGDKLINSLFNICNALDIKKLGLVSVDSAVEFYKKYGFVMAINERRNKMYKYLKDPYAVFDIDTQYYVSQNALNIMVDEDEDLVLSNFNFSENPMPDGTFNEIALFFKDESNVETEDTEWLRDYVNDTITIVTKNKTNNKILGVAFAEVRANQVIAIVAIFVNQYLIESSRFFLSEIENFARIINASVIKFYVDQDKMGFFKENKYEPFSSLKTNRVVYKKLKKNGGKRKKRLTKRKKHKPLNRRTYNKR